MKRITDSDFVYTNAVTTDVRKTFAKERLRLKRLAEQQQRDQAEAAAKTVQLRKAVK